jgi:hypothetical protein
VSEWTVRFDSTIDIDDWAEGRPVEVLLGLHSSLALCAESGPPADSWLVELEDGYRYRYWIIDINVTVEFIAVTYERWMLIKKID